MISNRSLLFPIQCSKRQLIDLVHTRKRCSEEIASSKEEMARMFSHFEGKLKVLDTWMYFLLALLFARYSSFYLCLFLFSFAFLSPYSAYFGVLSNFFGRFSRLTLRNYFLLFWVCDKLIFHTLNCRFSTFLSQQYSELVIC